MKSAKLVLLTAASLAVLAFAQSAIAGTDQYEKGLERGRMLDIPEACPSGGSSDYRDGCSAAASENEMDDEEDAQLKAERAEDATSRRLLQDQPRHAWSTSAGTDPYAPTDSTDPLLSEPTDEPDPY